MSYNGHRSKAYWNIALWIGNDEGLYRLALECIRVTSDRGKAAKRMFDILGPDAKTPDGYRYSAAKIRAAMVGL